MTPRSLFIVILKVIGVLLVKDILEKFPQFFVSITWFSIPEAQQDAIVTIWPTILSVVLELCFFYLLIFKTDKVIDTLNLDQGFSQENISFNTGLPEIVSIAIIVIGGLLVLNEVPNFVRQAFSYFQEKNLKYSKVTQRIPFLILAGVKAILGLALIYYHRTIVIWIVRQRKGRYIRL